jgi:hypothetical protein
MWLPNTDLSGVVCFDPDDPAVHAMRGDDTSCGKDNGAGSSGRGRWHHEADRTGEHHDGTSRTPWAGAGRDPDRVAGRVRRLLGRAVGRRDLVRAGILGHLDIWLILFRARDEIYPSVVIIG